MDYAINTLTGRMESAKQASGLGEYVCPVCKTIVSHRSGEIRKPHFAHWPGWGSSECENYNPSHYTPHHQNDTFAKASVSDARRRIELRLVIPTGADRAAWSVELVLPPCSDCRASLMLDVGGRITRVDLRGVVKGHRVTAELSVAPYRIVSFEGTPDPLFVAGVERECPGLPELGAAAFAASGTGKFMGFPRTQELRTSETFALLWREPAEPGFPDELVVERLKGRQGWSLALVTISDRPSPECTAWLQSFTGLRVAPPAPSIRPVWPFLTRNATANVVECVGPGMILLSAEMMSVGQQESGPTMEAQSASARFSSIGVERSPAFFVLASDGAGVVRVAEVNNPDVESFISFSHCPEPPRAPPAVELAFTSPGGIRQLVPLHQHRCEVVATDARKQGIGPEYLSMHPGAKGTLRVDGPEGRSEIVLYAGSDAPPHSQEMRIPPPDLLAKLAAVLADAACDVEIEFAGFGRLHLAGSCTSTTAENGSRKLGQALRSRLLSFMLQLGGASPKGLYLDDVALVKDLAAARPGPPLIPHHRLLMRDIIDCGFDLKSFGKGASS